MKYLGALLCVHSEKNSDAVATHLQDTGKPKRRWYGGKKRYTSRVDTE